MAILIFRRLRMSALYAAERRPDQGGESQIVVTRTPVCRSRHGCLGVLGG
jgi:hypothetical protein